VNYWLPPFLARFHKQYPDIRPKLNAGNTQQVAAATHEGLADIGFIEGAIDDPHLNIRSIEGDQLIVVVSPSHPFATKGVLEADDLLKTKWVLREPGSGTRGEFETALKSRSMTLADLDIALELPSNEAVCAAVEAGVGATAISNLVAEGGILSGKLVALEYSLPSRAFYVLHHKERYASRAELALLDLVGAGAKAPTRRREKTA
jgi:DNA-binding transcriptional LysR family regulator